MMEKFAFFYVENVLVSSNNPVWLQWSFDVMIGIFKRVGLWINVVKKVVMVCHPVPIPSIQSTSTY